MPRTLTATVYVALGAAALGLVVLNVLAWSGGLVDESSPTPAKRTSEQPAPDPTPPAPPAAAEPQPATRRQRAHSSPPTKTSLAISATRGDCWVEVRDGSSTGAVLYAGTLETGNTIRFNREKFWLRLGAASNVDVILNGQPSTIPPGTIELLLPA